MMSFRPLRPHENNETTLPPSSPAQRPVPYDCINVRARWLCERPSIAGSIVEERLVARWKEFLRWQPTLQICTQQNHLVFSQPLIHNLTALVFDLYNHYYYRRNPNNPNPNPNPHGGFFALKSLLLDFLSMTPPRGSKAWEHLRIFTLSAAPQALVMLYTCPLQSIRDSANHAIREFITKSGHYEDHVPNYKHTLALQFYNWLGWTAGIYDPLYAFCRANLNEDEYNKEQQFQNTNPGGLLELATRLLHDLELSSTSSSKQDKEKSSSSYYVGPALRDVKDLAAFLVLVKNEIVALRGVDQTQMLPLTEEELNTLSLSTYVHEVTCLRQIFFDLLHKLDECLLRIEHLDRWGGTNCRHYLAIMKGLNTISKLYGGPLEEVFQETMKQRKVAINYLVVTFAGRIDDDDDHKWILEVAKEATNFETRRHLALMMFHEAGEEEEHTHEMFIIDRSRLFSESFESMARADPESLRALLTIQFKNEQATGAGVLREWFYLVCQEIFNPQNNLFMACPNDRRRLFPNPASKVDPLHLEYFRFSGRVIASAMIHRVQVGIVFDRVFSLQLAGYNISIEDIRDADPYLYSSCKKILEMDPEVVDQDVLGLTFVHEVKEFGKRKVVELCADGKSMVVNSKNRKQYVDSLIQHRFVTAVGEHIAHFAQGFADVIGCGSLQKSFFQCLEPEDLDRMLYGSESAISVDDWKAHTEYTGFKETDSQISWFWKVVECMSTEQKRALLFFWTSIRYLPAEGFKRFSLCIYKTSDSFNHLPSSRTCFHKLGFPAYPSQAMMRDRLQFITQEHIIFSFGDED